jgi:tetratricopeptide (TPR) repeat protein
MKKVGISFLLLAALTFCFGCSKRGAEENTNIETPAATPLPEFTDAQVAFDEGNKLFDDNKIDLAIAAYEQAVKLNPDFADAYFKLGISYQIRERENEKAALDDANVEPTPESSKEKVRTKDSEKAFEKAVAAYKKLIDDDSKNAGAHYNLGRSYEKLNEDKDALKELREAVELEPENSDYQTELGKILIKLAQYYEAVRVLKKALELDESNLLAEELLDKAEAGSARMSYAEREAQKLRDQLNSNVRPSNTAANTPNSNLPANTPKPSNTKP